MADQLVGRFRTWVQGVGLRPRWWWWTVKWEPRDLWVGVYWDRPKGTGWSRALDVYVCVIPCLPLKVTIRRMVPDPNGPMGGRA